MSSARPLLMIPGPIEVSPEVRDACGGAPPGHLAPAVMEAFGSSLEKMRQVWMADGSAQPFIIGGGGTVAMDMAACNLVSPGDKAVVVVTGYFSDRAAEMLERAGANVTRVLAEVGSAPTLEAVEAAMGGSKLLFATHVDTSTGVRVDAEALARLATQHGALSIFDGVCATAAERFEMQHWTADVYLTGSQKAIGMPAGLALLVVSERAMAARKALSQAPPMYLDWLEWLPVMQAYEERRPAYFSTPPTNLILGLDVALRQILAEGIEARFELHRRCAQAMRAAWSTMGLSMIPSSEGLTANTLSAIRYPEGIDATLVAEIGKRGVVVAGGLHSEIRTQYFRVGHMGYAATRPEMLLQTLEAVGTALLARGAKLDLAASLDAAQAILGGSVVGSD
jgi:alanine-glyoxylate transaminase/serine-glyoxylate transaminase/serine-pyruvate transaminase